MTTSNVGLESKLNQDVKLALKKGEKIMEYISKKSMELSIRKCIRCMIIWLPI